MKQRSVLILIVLSLLLSFPVRPTRASMVVRMSFEQIVQGAELIIEGDVLSQQIRQSSISGTPFTYFKIAVIDVIKGDYPEETIEIGYMGGRIGEMTLKVSDMRMPSVGERGVYFIETVNRQQIHPLIGWQQGHYRVVIDPQTGGARVVAEDEKAPAASPRTLFQTQGTELEDFKEEIRGIVEGAQ